MKANKKKIKYATALEIIDDEKNVSYGAYQIAKNGTLSALKALNAAEKAAKGLKKNSQNPNTKVLRKAKIAAIDDYNLSLIHI